MSLSLGLGLALTRNKGGLAPPGGYVFLTDPDGAYLTETVDGVVYYLLEAI